MEHGKEQENKYYFIAIALLVLWAIVSVWLVLRELNLAAIGITPLFFGIIVFLLASRTSIRGKKLYATPSLAIFAVVLTIVALGLVLLGKIEMFQEFMNALRFLN